MSSIQTPTFAEMEQQIKKMVDECDGSLESIYDLGEKLASWLAIQTERDAVKEAFKNPPICCGVGGTNDCDKPCDKKYIGNNKSEMWGETDEFAKHPYHWNLCEDCFKIESRDGESESEDED